MVYAQKLYTIPNVKPLKRRIIHLVITMHNGIVYLKASILTSLSTVTLAQVMYTNHVGRKPKANEPKASRGKYEGS
jgi:hypothetical protein